jgi:hypothetical protein
MRGGEFCGFLRWLFNVLDIYRSFIEKLFGTYKELHSIVGVSRGLFECIRMCGL